MKTVLLLGGSLNGHRREVHGVMNTVMTDAGETYRVVPMCSHGEVHWFGVLDGADPLALLIAGYAPGAKNGRAIEASPAFDTPYRTVASETAQEYMARMAKDAGITTRRNRLGQDEYIYKEQG